MGFADIKPLSFIPIENRALEKEVTPPTRKPEVGHKRMTREVVGKCCNTWAKICGLICPRGPPRWDSACWGSHPGLGSRPVR